MANSALSCADPESFVRGGFLVDERREAPNTTISGPSLAAFRLSTLNTGLIALWFLRGSRPVLLRNPIFCDFSGGLDPLSPLTKLIFRERNTIILLGNHNVTPPYIHWTILTLLNVALWVIPYHPERVNH